MTGEIKEPRIVADVAMSAMMQYCALEVVNDNFSGGSAKEDEGILQAGKCMFQFFAGNDFRIQQS